MSNSLMDWGQALVTGPWSAVWPFFVLPVIATLGLRPVLKRVETMWDDPQRQARMAALAACNSGLLTVGLTLGLGFRSLGERPETLTCFAAFYGPLVVASVLLLRAGAVFAIRRIRLARLLRHAGLPSPRLSRLAADVGVPVRELLAESPVCFVSGLRHPCVVMSTGALRPLTDDEVRAALFHERAHLRSGDVFRASVVTTLAECGLLPSRRALRLYRISREASADAEAARYAGRATLAGVLVTFARSATRIPMTASLVEPDGLEQRVRLLIAPERMGAERGSGFGTLLGLACITAMALYPVAARILEGLFCPCGP